MKAFIAMCCLVSATQGSIIALVPYASQYHSQDSLGQYSYGYSGGPSSKSELRTVDGVTQGGYSYIDANNVLQSVSYVSDPINGFRVAATNLPHQIATVPQETPEVVAAKAAHFKAHEEAKARKRRSAVAFVPVVSSQYRTQDDLGQYTYGYNDGLSSKVESRAIDGTTNGGYSYVDGDGLVQNVQYIADANGFRVAASSLPPLLVAAAPLETPEVVAAKIAHFAAHAEAKARLHA